MKKLNEIIRDLRGKESLRDAAKRIGISHTYLDTIEKGFDKRSGKPINPTPETLKLISQAYDYSYRKLMLAAGYIEEEQDHEVSVSGQEIKLSPDEYKIFVELKKYPTLFHDLATDPEKKVKELIKLHKMKKILLEEEDEEFGDGFGELED